MVTGLHLDFGVERAPPSGQGIALAEVWRLALSQAGRALGCVSWKVGLEREAEKCLGTRPESLAFILWVTRRLFL